MSQKVVIIGAGPGGYVAAIRAAQLGCAVTLVDRDQVGGVCLNRGCIPTKALVASVELLHQARLAAGYGLELSIGAVDLGRIMARKDEIVKRLIGGVNFLLQKNKIDLVKGTGRFISPREVEVTGTGGERRVLGADAFIVATGTASAVPPVFAYDGRTVITSDEALGLTELPASLVVIGGGVIGCEFASIFSALGTKVKVIELMAGLLPMFEAELGRVLASTFKKRGIEVVTGAKVSGVTRGAGGARVLLENGAGFAGEKVLVSIGRRAETAGLDLAAAGVAMDERGRIPVDERLRTNVPHIYAIGDVNDLPYDLAHVASSHGLVAADNIAGRPRTVDERAVPSCVFTRPEIASVGMTTEEARAAGFAPRTGKFPFMANGKALAMSEPEGFVKMVADAATDKILGVHIMGAHASDLIAEAAVAISAGLTAQELAKTIHAHPTLAETVMEAAEAVHGRAIHV